MSAIKPTIGSPAKPIDDVVTNYIAFKSIEQNLWLTIGDVIRIPIGNEHQIGSGSDPDAAHSDFDTGQLLPLIPKHFSIVEHSIAIGVFKNHDPIVQLSIEILFAIRMRIALYDPKPSPSIGRDRNRLVDIGFSRKQSRLKTVRQLHPLECISRRRNRRFHFLRMWNLASRSSALVAGFLGASHCCPR